MNIFTDIDAAERFLVYSGVGIILGLWGFTLFDIGRWCFRKIKAKVKAVREKKKETEE